MRFGLTHEEWDLKSEPKYAVYLTQEDDQIDLIRFKERSMFKEYYLDYILKRSKKRKKWIYEG